MSTLPRTGIGVDVHAYHPDPDPDAVLHLAGLAWPGERPLAGTSDADRRRARRRGRAAVRRRVG